MSDEQKLIAAAQSDKTQFVKLYDLHFERIYKYLLTRVYDNALAEDLTSQTFLIALENIERYKYTGKPFSSWLYRIAINEMNSHYRKNKTEQKIMVREWQEIGEKFDTADAALKESEDKEETMDQIKMINQSMRKLKQADQDLLSLKYFEDLSYKEIAEVLGITVSNVGARLTRATQRLMKLCEA